MYKYIYKKVIKKTNVNYKSCRKFVPYVSREKKTGIGLFEVLSEYIRGVRNFHTYV